MSGSAFDQQYRRPDAASLVQPQLHVGMRTGEVAHGRRQCVAGLRMGRRDRQRAAVLVGEFGTSAAQVLGVQQQPLDDRQHRLPGRRQAGQPLARAVEELDAELVLELADLAADTGLRRVQRIGDRVD